MIGSPGWKDTLCNTIPCAQQLLASSLAFDTSAVRVSSTNSVGPPPPTTPITRTSDLPDGHETCLVKLKLNPAVIITPNRCTGAFVDLLKHNEEGCDQFKIVTASVQDFSADHAKRILLLLQNLVYPTSGFDSRGNTSSTLHASECLSDRDKLLYLSSVINFDNTEMMRACGGLLNFLLKNKLPNGRGTLDYLTQVVQIHIDQIMRIDTTTLEALGIFSLERHPVLTGSGKDREGLSLFGVMNKTRTRSGSRLLKQWFLHPLLDLAEIEFRYDRVALLASVEAAELRTNLEKLLSQIHDIPAIMFRLSTTTTTLLDWQKLLVTFINTIKIKQLMITVFPSAIEPLFPKVVSLNEKVLIDSASLIQRCIDPDRSHAQGSISIKRGVSEHLDQMREVYLNLDKVLLSLASEQAQHMNLAPNSLQAVYYPQIGFLIAIPVCEGVPLEQQLQYPDLEYYFHTLQYVYFKCNSCRKVDEDLGDIVTIMNDLEMDILQQVTDKLLEQSAMLSSTTKVLAELDCILTLSVVAVEYGLSRPKLSSENEVHISNGINLIQSLCVEGSFIPNDTNISSSSSMLQIITGPNCSGKSVYLKQVGLIIFMAQIGSFVPCEAATLGLCDGIYTRIRTRETVSSTLSTFAMDCAQVVYMLRDCTDRSLLLIDEYGKGTDPIAGASLLAGVVNHLVSLGSECPKTLISTHFTEIFAQLPVSRIVGYYSMDFVTNSVGADLDVVFLYKIVSRTGKSRPSSFAYNCVKLAGISEDIIHRAAQVAQCLENKTAVQKQDTCGKLDLLRSRVEAAVTAFLDFDCDTGNVDELCATLSTIQKQLLPDEE
ncbi:mutS protein 5 [Pelomyxa schiedti]|nr:mutS protein 5 [Pelomyxa schiedti]